MTAAEFFTRGIGKVYSKINPSSFFNSDKDKDFLNQSANDYIRELLHNNKQNLLFTKFGTYELSALLYFSKGHKGFNAIKDGFTNKRIIFEQPLLNHLCNNAGFFPNDISYVEKFSKLYYENLGKVDVLASYMKAEEYLKEELKSSVKVNLEGFYAPFNWENPWTKELKGKKVLVIHPFTYSIEKQYARREKIFKNPEVLPEFSDLFLIKAVQTIAGNKDEHGFNDWFEALSYMETEIDKVDFDVALIGCGAYGFPLASYVKDKGKIAIQLSGWTQMLFGIYGSRWLEDQPEYKKFVNDYWIRPDESERPANFTSIEKGCYW